MCARVRVRACGVAAAAAGGGGGGGAETLELALETASQPGKDQKNITQKLLEMALEKFEAEQKAGSHSVFFYYQHGMCLLELAALVDVGEFATRAVEVFGTAFNFRADPGAAGKAPPSLSFSPVCVPCPVPGAADAADADGNGDGDSDSDGTAGDSEEPAIKKCDVAEATAQAWLELARITATGDAGAVGVGAAKHFDEALKSHQKSVELAEDEDAKLAKLLSFSKMAQTHAERMRDAEGAEELRLKALQCAVTQAERAACVSHRLARRSAGVLRVGTGMCVWRPVCVRRAACGSGGRARVLTT